MYFWIRSKISFRGMERPLSDSEPPALETCTTQAGDDVRRPPHDVPDQSRAVILNHENHGALIEAKVIGSHPPARRAVRHFIGLVERRFEAVALRHAEVELGHSADRRDDDLWCEGK